MMYEVDPMTYNPDQYKICIMYYFGVLNLDLIQSNG